LFSPGYVPKSVGHYFETEDDAPMLELFRSDHFGDVWAINALRKDKPLITPERGRVS